jgi:hypothetical protein
VLPPHPPQTKRRRLQAAGESRCDPRPGQSRHPHQLTMKTLRHKLTCWTPARCCPLLLLPATVLQPVPRSIGMEPRASAPGCKRHGHDTHRAVKQRQQAITYSLVAATSEHGFTAAVKKHTQPQQPASSSSQLALGCTGSPATLQRSQSPMHSRTNTTMALDARATQTARPACKQRKHSTNHMSSRSIRQSKCGVTTKHEWAVLQ